ncbi:AAA domain-containing protein, partial [Endogone sp. FLAS-F59071]
VIATRLLAILPQFGISLTQCVLLGNKENLNLDGVLGNIFLDNRIIRVTQALGWLNQFHEAQRLLTKIICDIDDFHSASGSLAEQVINQAGAMELQGDSEAMLLQGDSEAKWSDKLKEAIADFSICHTDLINYANILTFELDSQLGRGGREVLRTVQSITEEYLKSIQTLSSNSISRLRTASRDTRFALEECAKWLKIEAPFLVDPNRYNTRDMIQSLILSDVRVIFCTVAVAGRTVVVSRSDITTVIVDEASQLVEAENIIVLKQSCERLCLVADPKQLPATVQSQLGRNHGYRLSMFERLLDNGWVPCLLDEQYRMHPEISAWPIAQFYSGVLRNGPNTTSSSYTKPWHHEEIFKPILFIECANGREERDEKRSYSNAMEADIVITQLQHFFKTLIRLDDPIQALVSIGVITPY